jgi:hypothetical protein
MLILPNWFDIMLEKVNIRSFFKFTWSLEMLIVCPKILNCLNLSNGMKAILKVTFSLNEMLIPEF